MEEASVAGESPDRSKQRESSAEPTSGSANPVPEARNAAAGDPRLAVVRESGGARPADTATRVLSVKERPETAGDARNAEDADDTDEGPAGGDGREGGPTRVTGPARRGTRGCGPP
ncbi:hypothetical protein GCM10020295_47760 [Streptomyces cinereospinus]